MLHVTTAASQVTSVTIFLRQVALLHDPFKSSIAFCRSKFNKMIQSTTIWFYFTHVLQKVSLNASLEKNVRNCNAEKKLSMMKNRGHLYFIHMGKLLLLPITVQINESSTANTLSFAEVDNIVGVRINMDTSKKISVIWILL